VGNPHHRVRKTEGDFFFVKKDINTQPILILSAGVGSDGPRAESKMERRNSPGNPRGRGNNTRKPKTRKPQQDGLYSRLRP